LLFLIRFLLGLELFTIGLILGGISLFFLSLFLISFIPRSLFEKKELIATSDGRTSEYLNEISTEPMLPEIIPTQEFSPKTLEQQPVEEKKKVEKTEAEIEKEKIAAFFLNEPDDD